MSATTSRQNTAAWLTAAGSPLEIREAPYPSEVGADEVVISNRALGFAIVDFYVYTSGFFIKNYPFISGFESAGTVVAVGANFADKFNVGDRVAYMSKVFTTSNPQDGTFQQYTVNDAENTFKIPDSMPFTDAAVLPLSLATAAAGLFQKSTMDLSPPAANVTIEAKRNEVIFISGGSTSVALSAIQMLHAAGYSIATTISPNHVDLLRSLGVEHIFDRTKPQDELVKEIVASLSDKKVVVGAFETVGGLAGTEQEPVILTAKVAAGLGLSKIVTVNPRAERPDGMPENVEIVPCLSTDIKTVNPEVRTQVFGQWAPSALKSAALKPLPQALIHGKGLESIQGAIHRVKEGVSAQKVVVDLA